MADLSELFDDIGIDPLLFFMMSGLFGGRRGGGMPFGMRGGMRGGMGGMMGGRRGPVVFMSSGGPTMFYAGAHPRIAVLASGRSSADVCIRMWTLHSCFATGDMLHLEVL